MLSKPLRGRRINQRHWSARGLSDAWLLNEGCGTKAFDCSGNGNIGTLTNIAAPPTAISGWGATSRGGGLTFDGTDDYVDCGNSDTLNFTDAITISIWVILNELPSVRSEDGVLLAKLHSATPWRSYSVYIPQGTDKAVFLCYNSVGGGLCDVASDNALSKDTWYHIVATLENGGKAKMYINNVLQSTQPNISDTLLQSNGILSIGGWTVSHSTEGAINSVQMYSRAISEDEISWLYRNEYAMFNQLFSPGILYIPITARSYGYIF